MQLHLRSTYATSHGRSSLASVNGLADQLLLWTLSTRIYPSDYLRFGVLRQGHCFLFARCLRRKKHRCPVHAQDRNDAAVRLLAFLFVLFGARGS